MEVTPTNPLHTDVASFRLLHVPQIADAKIWGGADSVLTPSRTISNAAIPRRNGRVFDVPLLASALIGASAFTIEARQRTVSFANGSTLIQSPAGTARALFRCRTLPVFATPQANRRTTAGSGLITFLTSANVWTYAVSSIAPTGTLELAGAILVLFVSEKHEEKSKSVLCNNNDVVALVKTIPWRSGIITR